MRIASPPLVARWMPPRSCPARPSATPSRTSCGRCASVSSRRWPSSGLFRCAGARRPARGRGGQSGQSGEGGHGRAARYARGAAQRRGVRWIDARVAPLLRGRVQRRHQPHFLWSAQASQSRIPGAARGRDHRHRRRTGARLRADEAGARFRIEARYGERVETSQADVLIVARLDAYSPLTDASPLSDNLLGRGLVRPYLNGGYHPGGIEIDQQLHPVGADGVPEARIWIVGFPVEARISIRTRCRAAHRLAPDTRRRSVRARADRHDRRRRDEACPASAGPVCRESAGVAGRGMRPRPFLIGRCS